MYKKKIDGYKKCINLQSLSKVLIKINLQTKITQYRMSQNIKYETS